MSKKSLTLVRLVLAISLIASLTFAWATEPASPPGSQNIIIPNHEEINVDSIGMPSTVDPQWFYDTASKELIMNVYDTLIYFEWEKTDEFVPALAVDTGKVVNPDDLGETPGEFFKSVIFEVRESVPFQLKRRLYAGILNPSSPVCTQWVENTPAIEYITQVAIVGREYHLSSWIDVNTNGVLDAGDQVDLTRKDNGWVRYYHVESLEWTGAEWKLVVKPKVNCEDIEYTFERWMIMDRTGGSTWMIYEALMGEYGADPGWPADLTNPIAKSVQSNCSHVWFNFKYDYNTTLFRRILAQPWSGVLNKDWAIDQGCWDGNWANWLLYHDPPVSPLDSPTPVMMGTGPYCLDWIYYMIESWRIVRFDEHYQGWPAPGCRDYVDAVTYRKIDYWGNRFWRFTSIYEADQCDLCAVPRSVVAGLEPWVEPNYNHAPPAGEIRYIKDLPTLKLDAMLFNFHIPNSTAYPGYESPYTGNENFSEYGTPWNFFQDSNVRYGFAYAFDYTTFINTAYLGEAYQPGSPLKKGEGFDLLYSIMNPNLTTTRFTYNSTLAKARFAAAWPTRVGLEGFTGLWATGFTMTIAYPTGNVALQTAAEMLRDEINGYNTLFHIDVMEVPWQTYLDDLVNYPFFKSKMPLCMLNWHGELGDPHENFYVFYHTHGDFANFQSWGEVAPDLNGNGKPDCDEKIEAARDATTYALREWYYNKLMVEWNSTFPAIMLAQPLGRYYERTWLQGWYYNPLTCCPPIYHPPFKYLWKGLDGDINCDNTVNVLDFGVISSHWHPGGLYPDGPLGYDRIADVNDVNSAAWPLPEGYPTYGLMYPYDGLVDMNDAGYAQVHWQDHWP